MNAASWTGIIWAPFSFVGFCYYCRDSKVRLTLRKGPHNCIFFAGGHPLLREVQFFFIFVWGKSLFFRDGSQGLIRRKMSLQLATLGIHYHHWSSSRMEHGRRWRRLVQVLGWKRWDEQQSPPIKTSWCDVNFMIHHQWLPQQASICAMIMPWMALNPFLNAFLYLFFVVCICCVWGDLVKLVNLQMAGLNEQQGYVLRLTSAEGYKEERVEVGIERKNCLVFLDAHHWCLSGQKPWIVNTQKCRRCDVMVTGRGWCMYQHGTDELMTFLPTFWIWNNLNQQKSIQHMNPW